MLAAIVGVVIRWLARRARAKGPQIAIVVALLAWLGVSIVQTSREFVADAHDVTPDWEIASLRGAKWLNANANEPAASFDAGVLGYFATAPVSNQDGLISSPDYFAAVRAGRADEAARDSGVRILANVIPVDVSDVTAWLRAKWFLDRAPLGRFELLWIDRECTPVIEGLPMQFRAYRWSVQ